MSSTERLYYQDPLLLRFAGRVVAHGAWNGAPSVVLDRSAFYPEAGGQMADRGRLGGLDVTDVQADDAGAVHHVVAGPLPAIGAEIEGEIDRDRRRVHMALHTGQHMLSRALTDVAEAATVSSRLGETGCTIDVDREVVDERRVAEAEDLVNAVIDDDLVVRAFFPTPDELRAIPLRRAPKVTENIRIVAVGDFDFTPCGGTHCTRSGQVGLVKVLGIERYKGKARVTFSAGRRARRELGEQAELLRELGRELTCGPRDVRTGLDKLRRELSEAQQALGRARGKLAEVVAAEIAAKAEESGGRAIALLEEGSVELLRAVATRVTARPDGVALLAARSGDGIAVMVSRGSASRFECGAFLKRAAAAAGGRGGGRPEHAEGRLPAGADWPAIVASLLAEG